MDEEIINDLKQFIATTVSQATATMATKDDIAALHSEMNERFEKVDQRFEKVDRRFDDQDAVLATIADAHAETLENHEERITKLENQAA